MKKRQSSARLAWSTLIEARIALGSMFGWQMEKQLLRYRCLEDFWWKTYQAERRLRC